MKRKFVLILFSALLGATLLTGCNPKNNQPNQTGELKPITIAGSTSVQPLSDQLVEVYNSSKNAEQKINVQGGGSGAGIKAAQTGAADIGASSRDLKAEEKTVKEFVIAKDGIAVVVNPKNSVVDLSMDQIKKIFSGEISDWKEVKGSPGKINLVIREAGSGTRGAFDELVMGETKVLDKATVQNGTGAVMSTVAGDERAIGYISVASLDQTVKAVTVDGTEATPENILSGSYKIARPFIYMTKDDPTGEVKSFIDWVLSSEGQAVVKEKHLVPVK